VADDPRKGHPEFTPSESPTRGKRVMGVRVPPLKPPPEPEPEPPKEPPMPPKPEPIQVERGTDPMQIPTGWQSIAVDFMKKWSPGGVAVALLLIFFGVGGKDFVKEVVLANEQNRKLTEAVNACTASTQALTQQIQVTTADVAAIKISQQAANAGVSDNRKNIGNVCAVVAKFNGGLPHDSWCYGEDGRGPGFEPLPPGGQRVPLYLVTTPWADSRAK
jgi:hypothetical protein